MKERSILFSASMIRALLAGTKTQTRRILRVQPSDVTRIAFSGGIAKFFGGVAGGKHWLDYDQRCPDGVAGDRLWVREACRPGYFVGEPNDDVSKCAYRADWSARAAEVCTEPKWTPSIYMPRRCSRITLDITRVRVERLHDISEEAARAEGVDRCYARRGAVYDEDSREVGYAEPTFRGAFSVLWEDINGTRAPWASNPWVWVVEFRRVGAERRAT